jgi:hypothetical protein
MSTRLLKPVYRETLTAVKDRSKRRLLIAGLEPGDVISVRPKGTRKAYAVTVEWLYYQAVKFEGEKIRRERKAKKETRA